MKAKPKAAINGGKIKAEDQLTDFNSNNERAINNKEKPNIVNKPSLTLFQNIKDIPNDATNKGNLPIVLQAISPNFCNEPAIDNNATDNDIIKNAVENLPFSDITLTARPKEMIDNVNLATALQSTLFAKNNATEIAKTANPISDNISGKLCNIKKVLIIPTPFTALTIVIINEPTAIEINLRAITALVIAIKFTKPNKANAPANAVIPKATLNDLFANLFKIPINPLKKSDVF